MGVTIDGVCEPAFTEVSDLLERQLADHGRGGAAVCVYHRGRPVVDIWAGAADETGTLWQRDSLSLSFSTTKGVTATALHLCVDRGLIDYDDRISDHWPEFAINDKEAITVRQVLCHEAGLFALADVVADHDTMLDWDAMVAAMEQLTPRHQPGTANGYHGVTFGFLVGELVHRASGVGFSEFVQRELAAPLGLDGCYVGTPRSEHDRVVTTIPPTDDGTATDPAQLVALAAQLGLEVRPDLIAAALPPFAFGLDAEDRTASLEAPIPAGNGCFTARSLARLYAALSAGGELDGVRLLSQSTLARATEIQNDRADLVIVFPMHWRLGYHGVLTTAGVLAEGFGHNGFGGSGAWADPERDLAMALTLNELGSAIQGDGRFMALGGAAVRAADAVSLRGSIS